MSQLLAAVSRVVAKVAAAATLDDAVSALHDGLAAELQLPHTYVMLVDESGQRLYTLSSRGFEQSGVGAELALGESPPGLAAAKGIPIRLPNLFSDRRYAQAIAGSLKAIPMPMLAQLNALVAVPFFAHGQVRGVLVAASQQVGIFGEEHEHALATLGSVLALKLVDDDGEDGDPVVAPGAGAATSAPLKVKHYAEDDSVFIDDVYVIKGVAGRLLARILAVHAQTGRCTFSIRQLRLEVGNQLAWAKDNLDSRLVLLRRRLEERPCGVRIARGGRGLLELSVRGPVALETL